MYECTNEIRKFDELVHFLDIGQTPSECVYSNKLINRKKKIPTANFSK